MDSERGSAGRSETPESLSLSDLTGDHESYLRWLQYGRWCCEYSLGLHSLMMPPFPTTPCQKSSLWDGLLPLSHFKQNGLSHKHYNGFHPSPSVYVVQPVLLPGVAFQWEEVPRRRGAGTYFPNTNRSPQVHGSPALEGRNQAPSRSPRNNGQNMAFAEPNTVARSSHKLSQPQAPFDMVSSSDSNLTLSHRGNGFPNPNALFVQPEGAAGFEFVRHASEASMSEKSTQRRPLSSSPGALPGMLRSRPALCEEQDS